MGRKRHGRRGELVAIVDLGSNAVRFLLAKVKPDRLASVPRVAQREPPPVMVVTWAPLTLLTEIRLPLPIVTEP